MINSEQLRIGNYVYTRPDNDEAKITGILTSEIRTSFGTHTVSFIDPIPLTEYWLLKFNAEKIEDEGDEYFAIQIGNNINLTISLNNDTAGIDLNWRSQGSQLWAHVKFVHQLQNLYYALTGEELQ